MEDQCWTRKYSTLHIMIWLLDILIKVHTLLYYPVTLAAVFAVMEMAKRDSWAIGMVRISAIMVHGAWMVQVCVIFPYNH